MKVGKEMSTSVGMSPAHYNMDKLETLETSHLYNRLKALLIRRMDDKHKMRKNGKNGTMKSVISNDLQSNGSFPD